MRVVLFAFVATIFCAEFGYSQPAPLCETSTRYEQDLRTPENCVHIQGELTRLATYVNRRVNLTCSGPFLKGDLENPSSWTTVDGDYKLPLSGLYSEQAASWVGNLVSSYMNQLKIKGKVSLEKDPFSIYYRVRIDRVP